MTITPVSRRATAFALFASLAAPTAAAQSPHAITIYRDPSCGCCLAWVRRLNETGRFTARVVEADMAQIKARLGVPNDLSSCHTATVGDYVIEGHVPPSDVLRLLQDHPRVRGIATPGMPLGSPGMETSDGVADAFDVIAFQSDGGRSVFTRHAARAP